MIKEDYWKDVDIKLNNLIEDGFVKLPSLDSFELGSFANSISSEMNNATFLELCKSHQSFLNQLGIDEFLVPQLYRLAKEKLDYTGDIQNQYHIARKVNPGNSKEMYRAHFDSHLFTIVFPIKIPKPLKDGSAGDLIYFPNTRKSPKSELFNILTKFYYKRFASKKGIEKLSMKKMKITDSFEDHRPLLFIGNTTLHTNKQVTADCSSYRLTLLAHFFDPSPRYGIGNLLRKLRAR